MSSSEKSPAATLSPTGSVGTGSEIINSSFGAYTEIGDRNYIENSSVGDYSYTGPYCFLQNCSIGKFSNIAAMVRIGPTAHPMDRATQHHFTYRRIKYGFAEEDDAGFFRWRAEQVCRIGHDTWIGHGAILMPGVRVGNGAVVGAGAVVTREIPPYCVAVGSPARVVRRRFDESLAEAIQATAWWDWPHETIAAAIEDFSLPAAEFVQKYGSSA